MLGAACGCAAPPGGPTSRPAGTAERPAGWETNLSPQPITPDWQPIVGRTSSDLARRHGLDAGDGVLLLNEEFGQATPTYVPGWQIVGFPSFRTLRLDGVQALELRGPADIKEPCGLERTLDAAKLAGRDVRVDIRLTCRSFLRAEALNKVRISLAARGPSGRSSEVVLPLEAGVSPGWEWQHHWVRFRDDLSEARVRILATGPGADLTVAAIRLMAERPLWLQAGRQSSTLHSNGDAAGGGGATLAMPRPMTWSANLIPDGDFETGAIHFFASASTRWPNGEERVVPLNWQFTTDPGIGGNVLTINLPAKPGAPGLAVPGIQSPALNSYGDVGPAGRIGFGPLNLAAAIADKTGPGTPGPGPRSSQSEGGLRRMFLSFLACGTRPATVAVSLRTRTRSLGRIAYPLTTQWQQFTGSFQFTSDTVEQRLDLSAAELVFEFISEPGGPEDFGDFSRAEPNICSLDAVVLQASPIVSRYVPSAPVEAGLSITGTDTTDLSNLFDLQEPVGFGLRLRPLVTAPGSDKPVTTAPGSAKSVATAPGSDYKFVGRLAIDLLDAWDLVVARQTRDVVLPPGGTHAEWVDVGILPRGYYRVLATLWDGPPGQSRVISQTSIPLAVISMRDPVPAQNLFGLSTYQGNISIHTTQLGAGWVRVNLPTQQLATSTGKWDFAVWQAIVGQCQRAQVDVVASVDLPATAGPRQSFIETWLSDQPWLPIGIVLRPPAIGRQSGRDYLQQLAEVRKLLAVRSPELRLVEDLSYLDGLPDRQTPADGQSVPIVWGLSGKETALPEHHEGYLEAIGQRRPGNTEVWELSAPVRLGSIPPIGTREPLEPVDASGGPDVAQLLRPPVDPVRSASRMVRAKLIRELAGASMVCSEAVALAPPRSVFDDDHAWLHEADLSPRAALVAFDLAAELLNNASLARWIDLPGGGRLLYFEKDDGRAVVVMWRPYGLSPTRLRIPALPASALALDCVGRAVALTAEDGRQIIEINEFVRYLIVPADQRETLRQALDQVAIEPTSASPAEPGPIPAPEEPASRPSTRPIR